MDGRIVFLVVFVFSGFVGGCVSSESGQGEDGDFHFITSDNLSEIVDMDWMVEEMVVDGEVYELVGDRPIVRFEKEGRVSGFASVNRFFGSMQIDDTGKVIWSNAFGATRMAGPADHMDQERVFLEELAKTDRLSVKGDRLYGQSPDGRGKLVFYVSEE